MNKFAKSTELARALYDPTFGLRCQVFSFAFYKTRLVGTGRNADKTHPINLRNPLRFRGSRKIFSDKAVCAECSLYIQLKNKTNIPFNKLSVYNVRIDRNGEIKNSRPCASCANLLTVFKPKSLFFTVDGGGWMQYV